MNSLPSPVETRQPADVISLLGGLAETVRYRLVPRADDEFLKAELYSLASILRILSTELPLLLGQQAEDLADLIRLLDRGSEAEIVGLDELRAAAAHMASSDDLHVRTRIRQYIERDLARGMCGLLGTWDSSGAATMRPQGSGYEDRPPSDELERRLADFLSTEGLGELSRVVRSTEGYGAETVVCHLAASGDDERVVVRIQWLDLPIARLIQTVDNQAQAMICAASADVPVAPVLRTISHDPTVGAPVLVTGYVPGFVPTGWTARGRDFVKRLAAHASDQWIGDLVRIHSAELPDVDRSTLRLGRTNREHQSRRVALLEQIYRDSELRADPLIEDVLAVLRDGCAEWGEAVLVHGDYRPGNIMYDADSLQVRAVLDWDCAYINDFHEDLGHVVAWPWRDADGLAAGLLARERLLDLYAQLSGRDVNQDAVRYYELQSAFRRYLGFAGLARAWLDRGGDVRMARAWLALRNDRVELGKLIAAI